MRLLRNFLYTLGFLAALTVHGDIAKTDLRAERYVDWGKLEYSRGPLRSDSFHGCSAVVLDCGKDGFLVHAFAGNYLHAFDDVNVSNVVDRLVERCKVLNIEPTHCEAYIHAGTKESLQRLSEGFRRSGMPIKVAEETGSPEVSF